MTYKPKFEKDIKPPSHYVSDDLQTRLIELGQGTTKTMFEVGDIANMLYLGHVRNGEAATMATICWAVGIFYGKKGRTISKYAQVAAQYNEDARAKYSVLSFNHFALAKSLGPQAEEMLEYSIDNLGTAAGAIAEKFRWAANGGPEPCGPDVINHGANLPDLVTLRAPTTPEKNIPWLNTVGRIMNDLGSVKVLFARDDIPKEINDELERSTALMERALNKLWSYLTNP